ncbi:hypothetical protein P175DRAFT_0446366 [Aspergillus ochraceoroseus IBT 24754]|uniref:Phosphatidylserine decarboxylase n=1 Tax=Aspergillus ochraceoroseus IBT 24754 TaxID=1392256 RepID=A0A2T5LLM7_9EURO|nr:uncharacterized protein P175DRAFT_0446366 [Aspergillus ochraceoroseus IBT 24754]PTU17183.1 hypothetical protein P175DRAFT_0446366 [Aspergillus ochraceoroseus IBT 24754]
MKNLWQGLVDGFSTAPVYSPLVEDLKRWIMLDSKRRINFETAIQTARSSNAEEIKDIDCLEDYLRFVDEQLHWIPTEAVRPKDMLFRLRKMWFILDQPSIAIYQSPISPDPQSQLKQPDRLAWLSRWMVQFSNELGEFMDSPASAAALDTFKSNPAYNIEDYLEPRQGWRTFNEFFCRTLKPGRRPISSIGDNSVLTSPADFQFKELHYISEHSTITTKGLTWHISQILAESPYKDYFSQGVWMHGFLNVDDYHRVHTPVSGTVLEARIIMGQNYMKIQASSPSKADTTDQNGSVLDIPNETGYQFCQARGLIVLNTGLGFVAVLPVGMATVSSVVLTAEVGVRLHKGEELAYFQFGGSDVVLIFDAQLKAEITMQPGHHYRMGTEIGRMKVEGVYGQAIKTSQ